jgi:hypothetical protein
MDKKRLAHDIVDDLEYEHEDPDVPFSAIRQDVRDFIYNHSLADEAVKEHDFNREREMIYHPHSGKAVIGAMTLGALIGAVAAKKTGADQVINRLRGGVGGALLGFIPGAIVGRTLTEGLRNQMAGPARYDAYNELYDDASEEAEKITEQKIPIETRIQARAERMRQENMRHAINAASTLGHSYIRSQEQKKAFYMEGIEKIAEERKDNPDAKIPRNRYKEYDTSKETLKRSGKYMGAGTAAGAAIGALKGGKAGAIRGAVHGLVGGGAAGTIHQGVRDWKSAGKRYEAGSKALKKGRAWGPGVGDKYVDKKAFYIDGIEKIAEDKKVSGAMVAGTGVAAGAANLAGRGIGSAKITGEAEGAKGISKQVGAGFKSMAEGAGGKGKMLKNLAMQHGKGAAITGALAGAGAYAAKKFQDRKKEATEYYKDEIEKIASAKMEAVKKGAKKVVDRLSFKRTRDLSKTMKTNKKMMGTGMLGKVTGKSMNKDVKRKMMKETAKSTAAHAGIAAGAGAGAYAMKKKKQASEFVDGLLEKLAGAKMQAVKSGARKALDRLSFKKTRELSKTMKTNKKLIPGKVTAKAMNKSVRAKRNKEAVKSVGAHLAIGAAGAGTAYGMKKKSEMTKTAAEEKKRSIGRDLAEGARKGAMIAAPVAAYASVKNKAALMGVGKKIRTKAGEALGKLRDKSIATAKATKAKQPAKPAGKLETHLQKSELGKKLLAGLQKGKKKVGKAKDKVVGSKKVKEVRNQAMGGAAVHGAIGAIHGITHGAIKGIKDIMGIHHGAKLDKQKFGKIVGGSAVAGAALKASKPDSHKKEATEYYKTEIEKLAFSGFNRRQKERKLYRNEF